MVGSCPLQPIMAKANWSFVVFVLCQVLQPAAAQCLSGGDETIINNALSAGGAGAVVQLCPGSTFSISNTVTFTADDQELSTQGYPDDSTRALIQVASNGNSVSTLVQGSGLNGIALKNVVIDGNRGANGKVQGGGANIEIGGSSTGQVVSGVASKNPRAWGCMHIAEAGPSSPPCTDATIENNDIGPCGTGDYDSAGNGNWADGISLGCTNSLVSSNTVCSSSSAVTCMTNSIKVSGSTDGGIVIFGCPGSTITGNTIISSATQRGWGAINMVDYITYGGSYAGVEVSSNTITGQLLFNLGIAVSTLPSRLLPSS